MQLFQRVLRKLTGLHYPQEYLCISEESKVPNLQVYHVEGKKVIRNITDDHGFTGYHPLIFVLTFPGGEPPKSIDLIFSHQSLLPNEFFRPKDALAMLSMKLIRSQSYSGSQFAYYEGLRGYHHFLSFMQKRMLHIYNQQYNRKPNNVFLEGNLYDQVQIAYSFPRKISLVTVGESQLYNLFPTDLHSPVGRGYYVDSLRHEGEACKQVEKTGRILLSEMPASAFSQVYSLGKNHMQPLKEASQFPFGPGLSPILQLPLPRDLQGFQELELVESFTHGIHKLFLFRIISEKCLRPGQIPLTHIHNSYATWLYNKGLAGNYLLR